MFTDYTFGSLTRISDLAETPFAVDPLPKDIWATGDYVVGRVTHTRKGRQQIELVSGRMIEVLEGDLVVGAFGVRRATLEAVGSWRSIRDDGEMHSLTGAGLFGRATSVGQMVEPMVRLAYRGHVTRGGTKVVMKDFALTARPVLYDCPTVLLYGTSMSSGKTSAGKAIIRELRSTGKHVVAAKLTGAGRYRDILVMRDAGAEAIFDFVDVGLPSTVCPRDEFRTALATLLSLIADQEPDVVVAEAGASPFEPYNGDIVMEAISDQVQLSVLCASDPYAVVGVVRGFDLIPDIVAGIATNTEAGIQLIHNLTDREALNLVDPASRPRLAEILALRLTL